MISFDFRAFERAARDMAAAADQIPFALAQSLNDGAEVARTQLAETVWPTHVKARDPRFIKAALTTRGNRATKRSLQVAIVDKLGRASLLEHVRGGTKRPRGSAIAVPDEAVKAKRTARGVPKSLRPRALKDSFRKGDAIYRRVGTYTKAAKGAPARDDRKLQLMYVLRPAVPIRADVPFDAEFARIMPREVWRAFGPRLRSAMASRRG